MCQSWLKLKKAPIYPIFSSSDSGWSTAGKYRSRWTLPLRCIVRSSVYLTWPNSSSLPKRMTLLRLDCAVSVWLMIKWIKRWSSKRTSQKWHVAETWRWVTAPVIQFWRGSCSGFLLIYFSFRYKIEYRFLSIPPHLEVSLALFRIFRHCCIASLKEVSKVSILKSYILHKCIKTISKLLTICNWEIVPL